MSSPLTTHVLDTSSGAPAAGMLVTLFKLEEDGSENHLAESETDVDGRVSNLFEDNQSDWAPAVYRLRFKTKEYFEEKGMECFYPHCDVVFTVKDIASHYHVPLLLSPYGYTTYRGS